MSKRGLIGLVGTWVVVLLVIIFAVMYPKALFVALSYGALVLGASIFSFCVYKIFE